MEGIFTRFIKEKKVRKPELNLLFWIKPTLGYAVNERISEVNFVRTTITITKNMQGELFS